MFGNSNAQKNIERLLKNEEGKMPLNLNFKKKS